MRKVLLAGLILLSGVAVFGQSISTKKDIAVFRLSYYDWNIPPGALAQVDQGIQDVFINIGRFNVIGMRYRLSENDIGDFMDRLKQLKESQTDVPKEFSLGKEAFTQADLNRLVGSFVIVVPVVTSYTLSFEYPTGFTADLVTSFTFISGESSNAIAHFSIRTIGVGVSPRAAASEAASAISQQLVYQIRNIPQFQLKTGVIDVNGSTVLIEFGRNMGVRVGDEYAIMTSRVLRSGYIVSDRTGLIVVKEVKDNISYARVIYSSKPPQVGDQLKEIPRIGFESSVYLHVVAASDELGSSYAPVYTIGTLSTITRGFYNFRPVIGVEMPLAPTPIGGYNSYGAFGLPLNLYLGGELNWRIWRFDIVPLIAVGIGGVVPVNSGESFFVSVAGGFAQVSLSYLISPEVKVFADLGYAQWLPTVFVGWGGFYGGVGVAFNY